MQRERPGPTYVCWFAPRLFQHLRARGIGVYVWVLNSEAAYERAFRSGVTGVMTDHPAMLRRFLDANPDINIKTR